MDDKRRMKLQQELDEAVAEASRLMDACRPRWYISAKPLPFKLRVGSGSRVLVALFLMLHVGTGIAGIAFIINGGSGFLELGVAMVVGALLGAGAFFGQAFAVAVTTDHSAVMTARMALNEYALDRLRELGARQALLREQLATGQPTAADG
jgi:hypothetical protein